jgi:hypothetical protein
MLGLGPIASRSIAGSPFKLTLVELFGAASGSLLTFGGVTAAGATVELSASGPLLTFGGSASAHWTQEIAASGNILSLGGTANLTLVGRPLVLTALAEQRVATAQPDRFVTTALAQPYISQGS